MRSRRRSRNRRSRRRRSSSSSNSKSSRSRSRSSRRKNEETRKRAILRGKGIDSETEMRDKETLRKEVKRETGTENCEDKKETTQLNSQCVLSNTQSSNVVSGTFFSSRRVLLDRHAVLTEPERKHRILRIKTGFTAGWGNVMAVGPGDLRTFALTLLRWERSAYTRAAAYWGDQVFGGQKASQAAHGSTPGDSEPTHAVFLTCGGSSSSATRSIGQLHPTHAAG